MARLPARVDWIIHERTRTKIALRLNKSSMTFQAEWAGKTYWNKDGAVLRKQILEMVAASEHLEFSPVIEVKMQPGRGCRYGTLCVDLSMELDRWFYASSNAGLLKLAWEDQDNKQKIKHWNPGKDFTGMPCHTRPRYAPDFDRYYLAYTEDLWAGLGALFDTVERARAKVEELLGTDDAVHRLETVGAELIKALPAPKEEVDEIIGTDA